MSEIPISGLLVSEIGHTRYGGLSDTGARPDIGVCPDIGYALIRKGTVLSETHPRPFLWHGHGRCAGSDLTFSGRPGPVPGTRTQAWSLVLVTFGL